VDSLQEDRLDRALVARGFCPSRTAAQAWIRAGLVRVGGQTETRPSRVVRAGDAVAVDATPRYVGRGGEKLAAALAHFGVDVSAAVCADVGASTGGFTHCLLEHGAARVHAIDVGRGQLHASMRADPRVVVREGVDARSLPDLGERVGFAAIDVAFVSSRLVLPAVRGWLAPDADLVLLLKPQFEAGPGHADRAGVVRDRAVHERVLRAGIDVFEELGLPVRALCASPIRGGSGNAEFLLHARYGARVAFDAEAAVAAALAEVHGSGADGSRGSG
jgi:23S rRNA (cytidine1920-2'-O)/16S rRNA (cytidine1409-2'-O)-methyltransferase